MGQAYTLISNYPYPSCFNCHVKSVFWCISPCRKTFSDIRDSFSPTLCTKYLFFTSWNNCSTWLWSKSTAFIRQTLLICTLLHSISIISSSACKTKQPKEEHLPVWVAIRVKWAHVIDFLQVNIREHQFVIATIDNCWPVRASKHISGGQGLESFQNCWLCSQRYFLLLW